MNGRFVHMLPLRSCHSEVPMLSENLIKSSFGPNQTTQEFAETFPGKVLPQTFVTKEIHLD